MDDCEGNDQSNSDGGFCWQVLQVTWVSTARCAPGEKQSTGNQPLTSRLPNFPVHHHLPAPFLLARQPRPPKGFWLTATISALSKISRLSPAGMVLVRLAKIIKWRRRDSPKGKLSLLLRDGKTGISHHDQIRIVPMSWSCHADRVTSH